MAGAKPIAPSVPLCPMCGAPVTISANDPVPNTLCSACAPHQNPNSHEVNLFAHLGASATLSDDVLFPERRQGPSKATVPPSPKSSTQTTAAAVPTQSAPPPAATTVEPVPVPRAQPSQPAAQEAQLEREPKQPQQAQPAPTSEPQPVAGSLWLTVGIGATVGAAVAAGFWLTVATGGTAGPGSLKPGATVEIPNVAAEDTTAEMATPVDEHPTHTAHTAFAKARQTPLQGAKITWHALSQYPTEAGVTLFVVAGEVQNNTKTPVQGARVSGMLWDAESEQSILAEATAPIGDPLDPLVLAAIAEAPHPRAAAKQWWTSRPQGPGVIGASTKAAFGLLFVIPPNTPVPAELSYDVVAH